MTDLSSLSDTELQALYQKGSGISIRPASNDLSQMSDADLMKAYAAPSSVGADAVKSIASGLGSGTIGTLGLPGNISNMLAHGSQSATNFLADKFGFDRGPQIGNTHFLPTSEDIQSTVTDPIVSPDYQPQTGLGQGLKTGAEFLPNMMAGGPEGALAKFGANVAAPAAGALAGNAIGGPIGGMLGALTGAAGANKFANSIGKAQALKAATPSLPDVKNTASNAYDALTSRNVAIPLPQSTLDNLANDIKTTLNNKGIRPSNADSIHNAVDEIRAPATPGAADVADLVAARQSIKQLLGKPDSNKAGAFVALDKIEKQIEQASPGTMQKLQEADKNWGAAKANEALDKKLALADLQASSTDSGMNAGNKIRQKAVQLLSGAEAKYLPAEAKADLEKIARGTATQNIIRKIDRLLGGGGGLGMMVGGAASGYASDGPEGALMGMAAAHGLRTAFNRSVMRQAEQAAANMRRRSPLGMSMPLSLPGPTNPALAGLLPPYLARPKN